MHCTHEVNALFYIGQGSGLTSTKSLSQFDLLRLVMLSEFNNLSKRLFSVFDTLHLILIVSAISLITRLDYQVFPYNELILVKYDYPECLASI